MKKSGIVKRDANEIVVYQPDGVKRIDVRFDGETVWLLQAQIADLLDVLWRMCDCI